MRITLIVLIILLIFSCWFVFFYRKFRIRIKKKNNDASKDLLKLEIANQKLALISSVVTLLGILFQFQLFKSEPKQDESVFEQSTRPLTEPIVDLVELNKIKDKKDSDNKNSQLIEDNVSDNKEEIVRSIEDQHSIKQKITVKPIENNEGDSLVTQSGIEVIQVLEGTTENQGRKEIEIVLKNNYSDPIVLRAFNLRYSYVPGNTSSATEHSEILIPSAKYYIEFPIHPLDIKQKDIRKAIYPVLILPPKLSNHQGITSFQVELIYDLFKDIHPSDNWNIEYSLFIETDKGEIIVLQDVPWRN